MKLILFTVFLIVSNCNIYAQDIDKLKKSDTIYIYFKVSEEQIHFNTKIIRRNNTKSRDEFLFKYGMNFPISFIHDYNQSPEEKKECKSFLKKNRDLILTYEFLSQYSIGEATELIINKKKVYLIDYDDIGWFRIILKEVKAFGPYVPPIE